MGNLRRVVVLVFIGLLVFRSRVCVFSVCGPGVWASLGESFERLVGNSHFSIVIQREGSLTSPELVMYRFLPLLSVSIEAESTAFDQNRHTTKMLRVRVGVRHISPTDQYARNTAVSLRLVEHYLLRTSIRYATIMIINLNRSCRLLQDYIRFSG
jgi:hypothetical protein